uniref:Putative conserved plasma membrane protein n=1 Tax=Corethrella appendiculata TaxID=1370023 RepID=U5EUY6_9DIPT
MFLNSFSIFGIILVIKFIDSSDITDIVFGSVNNDAIPAAYGDFNSDELTDVFVLRNNSKTIQILFGNDDKPLLQAGPKCEFKNFRITSIVPGDFNGDAFMDLLFTVEAEENILHVYINFGGSDYINCTEENSQPLIKMKGEPLALDFDKDMIIDLFGMDEQGVKKFWIFKKAKKDGSLPTIDEIVWKTKSHDNGELAIPHSHAIIDLNKDFTADLFITKTDHFEVWYGNESNREFIFGHDIKHTPGFDYTYGQSIFIDLELNGNLVQIIPAYSQQNSLILVEHKRNLESLQVDFKDPDGNFWGFIPREKHKFYFNTVTLRSGDFNLDGYPDLLATLRKKGTEQVQTFLLENIPCHMSCLHKARTFAIRWNALAPFSNGTVMGSFYDFYQDGILDVILLQKIGEKLRPVAFRNTLDYDANFIKVIVLTGLSNRHGPKKLTPLGRKKRTYGTNLPGPRIEYNTTTQDGDPQHGASAQLPQSAYFALHLPYTTFGLGRTPNFVDSLTVGLSNRSKTWTQIIPNSQMIVVPWPIEEPDKWKAQLFVTPSKLILMSVIALGGICLVILLIILVLFAKEKREDKRQRQQEAHRYAIF